MAWAVALAIAGAPLGAEVAPEYRPLLDPIGRMLDGCLEQSYDEDSALDCNRLTSDACLAMGEGGATTYGMAMCTSVLFELWDAELNRLWPLVLDELDETAAGYMREEQRAWSDHKEAACRFAVAQVAGGSMAAYVGGYCLVDMTAERVAQFREILR